MLLIEKRLRMPYSSILRSLPWSEPMFRIGLSVAAGWLFLVVLFAVFG